MWQATEVFEHKTIDRAPPPVAPAVAPAVAIERDLEPDLTAGRGLAHGVLIGTACWIILAVAAAFIL